MLIFVLYTIGIIFLFYLLDYILNKVKLPKGYIEVNKKYEIIHNNEINRDRFNVKKIPHQIDCIVIGSGISGLTTAGLLSKVGKKVLVLEQHYIAGGSTHCFEDKGWEFDTGIHYIGNIKSRDKVLNLIMKNKVEWIPLGHDNDLIYDNIIIEEKKYSFRPGRNKMINYLSNLFPKEKDNIVKYINLVQRVAKMELFFILKIIKPLWLVKIIYFLFCYEFRYYAGKTEYEVLSEHFTDERLKYLISGLSIDGGPPPM